MFTHLNQAFIVVKEDYRNIAWFPWYTALTFSCQS